MTQTLVFKYALVPTPKQKQQLASHVGATRYAYNWAINEVINNWEQVKNDPTIPYINTSAYGLRKRLNEVKDVIAPWWAENSKEAFANGTANASKALNNWLKARNKTRKGKMGFPHFRSRLHDSQTGITFTTGTLRLEDDNTHFTLPRIGKIKLLEKAKPLRWLLTQDARIANVTVRNEQNRWFVAINVKVEDNIALQYFNGKKKIKPKQPVVGIDVGLKVFLADSNGNVVDNPKFLRKSLARIRKANKRLSRRRGLDKRTGVVASNRWVKAHTQVVKAHAKIVNQRKDFLHKASKSFVDDYEVIGVEDLSISSMVRNKHLSLSISDAGWGEFKRQLIYKAKWYGSDVVQVDKFYPSSKKCSGCGTVKVKLSLSERVFKCEHCGLVINRDFNAALNIKGRCLQLVGNVKRTWREKL